MQPFILGSLRTALARDASGCACFTVLASAFTVTLTAGTFRLLTIVRAVAGLCFAGFSSAGRPGFAAGVAGAAIDGAGLDGPGGAVGGSTADIVGRVTGVFGAGPLGVVSTLLSEATAEDAAVWS